MLAIFGLVRPAMKSALKPLALPSPSGNTLDALVDDDQALPGLGMAPQMQALEAPQTAERLARARTLAKQNPAAVANIVRDWVSGEPA